MKKFAYLSILILSLALVSTSCCKDDDPIVPDTLEQKYPDWANLTWVSTVAKTNPTVQLQTPKLAYTIVDNVITETVTDEYGSNDIIYNGISVTSTKVTFSVDNSMVAQWNYTKPNSTTIVLEYGNFLITLHIN